MSNPSLDAMVTALIDDAIRREIQTNGRITSLARFKASVRESILDGERCHPGYITLCWTELAKRRAKNTPQPARRPTTQQLDDDDYQPADDYTAERWRRICAALITLPAGHPLRQAATDIMQSIHQRDETRRGRDVTSLERDQDDHHARQALGLLEQLAAEHGVNLHAPGRPAAHLAALPSVT